MPCMGPSGPTEEEVNQATDAVLELLKDKFEVWDIDLNNLDQGFSGWYNNIHSKNRNKAIAQLRAAVYEILWQDACEKF